MTTTAQWPRSSLHMYIYHTHTHGMLVQVMPERASLPSYTSQNSRVIDISPAHLLYPLPFLCPIILCHLSPILDSSPVHYVEALLTPKRSSGRMKEKKKQETMPPPLRSLSNFHSNLHFDNGRGNRILSKFARDLCRSPLPPLLLPRRHFRAVPSVSAGRRLHFSGLERSIRNEGHQFNVAFSGKERREGAYYIRGVHDEKIMGKQGSLHLGQGRQRHPPFPRQRRRQQYHYGDHRQNAHSPSFRSSFLLSFFPPSSQVPF